VKGNLVVASRAHLSSDKMIFLVQHSYGYCWY